MAKDKRRVIMDERIVRGFKRRGRKERRGTKIKRRPFQNKNFYQSTFTLNPPLCFTPKDHFKNHFKTHMIWPEELLVQASKWVILRKISIHVT